MAGITSSVIGTGITGALGLGQGIYQTISGIKNRRDAQRALNNYERQELTNAFENIPISTIGSDQLFEQNQINSSNMVDAARQGGVRGIVGAIPRIVASNNEANQEARAYLDNQVNRRNYAIAGDQQNIRAMQEARENADLAGLGQQLQTGRQDTWSGIQGIADAGAYMANNIDWRGDRTITPVNSVAGTMQPQGLAPLNYNNMPTTGGTLPNYPSYNPWNSFRGF